MRQVDLFCTVMRKYAAAAGVGLHVDITAQVSS